MAAQPPTTGSACGWFMVPPGLLSQLGFDVTHLGQVDIAQAQYACGAQADAFRAKGLQEYATQADAENAAGHANSQANPVQSANPVSGLAAIGDFFARLTQRNTWVRVGEVAVGVILLAIGVNAMFKGRPLAAVTGAAGTVGKVVP